MAPHLKGGGAPPVGPPRAAAEHLRPRTGSVAGPKLDYERLLGSTPRATARQGTPPLKSAASPKRTLVRPVVASVVYKG